MSVLELDYLMDVGRRGSRPVLATLTRIPVLSSGAGLKLGLLSSLVTLAVVVGDFEDFLEILGRHQSLLGRRRIFLRSRLGVCGV